MAWNILRFLVSSAYHYHHFYISLTIPIENSSCPSSYYIPWRSKSQQLASGDAEFLYPSSPNLVYDTWRSFVLILSLLSNYARCSSTFFVLVDSYVILMR